MLYVKGPRPVPDIHAGTGSHGWVGNHLKESDMSCACKCVTSLSLRFDFGMPVSLACPAVVVFSFQELYGVV